MSSEAAYWKLARSRHLQAIQRQVEQERKSTVQVVYYAEKFGPKLRHLMHREERLTHMVRGQLVDPVYGKITASL